MIDIFQTDEYEGSLLNKNPKGGRPQLIGKLLFEKGDSHEISDVRESSAMRFFLGYCKCGTKITVGHNRAEVLISALKQKGIQERRVRIPLRHKVARLLLGKDIHR